MDEQKVFNKGERVENSGKYVCVPCGYHHEYKAGELFGECTSCLTNNKDKEEELEDIEGSGMWEKQEEDK